MKIHTKNTNRQIIITAVIVIILSTASSYILISGMEAELPAFMMLFAFKIGLGLYLVYLIVDKRKSVTPKKHKK